MAKAKASAASTPEAALERVRDICMGFPAVEEKLSHGSHAFHVKGRHILSFVDDHHNDGRLAVWCKSTHEDQKRLVAQEPDRYFVPPYVGVQGWVGVRLDRPSPDWIGLSILVEQGWTAVAPASVRSGKWVPKAPPPPPPTRKTTDEKVAKDALARMTKICLALDGASFERESQHATFRAGAAKPKVFAYFLDNHHGDGIVSACVKVDKADARKLVASDPKRFHAPAYMFAHGWVGIRLDAPRADWKDVAARIAASHAAATTKPAKATKLAKAKKPAKAKKSAKRRQSPK